MHSKLRRIIGYILISSFLACSPTPILKVKNRQLLQIGTSGSEPGEFQEPRGIHNGPDDTLIVTDFRNYRVQQIDRTGRVIRTWGTKGNRAGEFNDPTDAVMDNAGNLFVVDTWNHRIQKCLASGEWISNWGSEADFYAPRCIAVDSQGKVYVSNTSQHNIRVFNNSGKLLTTWGSKGSGNEHFHDPVGLAIGPDGNVYVVDTGNHRIKVLGPGGQTLHTFPIPDYEKDSFYESFVSIGSDGRIYLSIPQQNHILVLNPDGSIYSRFGHKGGGPEELLYPTGILIDDAHAVFISDSLNHRIVKYMNPGPLLSMTETPDRTASSFLSISRVIIDCIALAIVASALFNRISNRKKTRPVETIVTPTSWQLKMRTFSSYPNILSGIQLSGTIIIALSLWLFSTDHPAIASGLTVLGLIFLIIRELPRSINDSIPISSSTQRHRSVIWGTLLLLIVTVTLRLLLIDQIPWGINNDAAWNGTFARTFLDGKAGYTPFTDQAWGKETMYFYLVALSFKFFGVSRISLLLPCTIVSILTVMTLLFVSKKLFDWRVAFLTAFIYSAIAWNLVFSRTGYRAVLSPLCLLLVIGFYYLAIDTSQRLKKLLYFIVAGSFLGLGLNTYFSFRGIPVMMMIIGIHSWIEKERFMRRNWWGLLVFLAFAVLFFLPLAFYAMDNYATFMARSNFLFVGNKIKESGSLMPLLENVYKNFLVFTYKAKVGNFFNNDWPIITPILAFFAIIGFALHIRYIFKRPMFVTVMVFCFGLLPAILSEPDAARMIMTPVALAFFAATGVISLLQLPHSFISIRIRSVLTVIAVITIIGYEVHFYFVRLGNDYFAQYGYACKNTQIGLKALDLSHDNQIYISQAHFIDTPKFLCYGVPGDVFGITNGEVIEVISEEELTRNTNRILEAPVPEGKGLAFILEYHSKNDSVFKMIKSIHPNGVYKIYKDKRLGREPIYYTYIISSDKIARDADRTTLHESLDAIE